MRLLPPRRAHPAGPDPGPPPPEPPLPAHEDLPPGAAPAPAAGPAAGPGPASTEALPVEGNAAPGGAARALPRLGPRAPLAVGAREAEERKLRRAGEAERLFYALGLTPAQYAVRVALPLLAMGGALALVLPMVLVPFTGELVGQAVSLLGGLLVGAMALLLPFQAREGRRNAINQQMHVFVTHVGVLSTTPMARAAIFGVLAAKREYGPLAAECARVHALVSHWHLALPEACRFIAARTPSDILADFLDRLAHALEAGDRLEEFMQNEQAVVMHEYASHYRRRLYDLGVYREMFSSMMMSVAFLAVFALLMPVLADVPATALLPLVFLAASGMLVVLLALAWIKTPRDPLWQGLQERSEAERRANLLLPLAAAAGILAGAMAWSLGVPPTFAVALGSTAGLAGAMALRREEALVRRRDDNYPAFIRSLGAGVASRGGAPQEVVAQLARHDYGPLTPPLRRLDARLATRVHNAAAWRHFAVEGGSHLIYTFNNMFLEGTRVGGNALRIGGLISRNVAEMLALRKERAQVAAGLKGSLFGMAGAIAFTLYLNLGIVTLLTSIFADVQLAQSVLPGVGSFRDDLGVVEAFLLGLGVAYAAAAAAVVRIVDGGRLRAGLTEFAIMAWIAAVTSTMVGQVAGFVL